MSSFELLYNVQQRAEQLQTGLIMADNHEVEQPHMESDLNSIFSRSQKLWARKKYSDASNLFSIKPKALLKNSSLLERKNQSLDVDYLFHDSKDDEISKFVEESFQRAKIESERAFINQTILEKGANTRLFNFAPKKTNDSLTSAAQAMDIPLEFENQIFSQSIDENLNKGCSSSIASALINSVKKFTKPSAKYVWDKVFAVCLNPPIKPDDNIREFRSSKRWSEHIISCALRYLQDQYHNFMEKTIEENLERAKRGGVPGTLSLVEAFLNVKHTHRIVYEDKLYDDSNHPIWAVLFYCLRIGDLQIASRVATKLFNIPQSSTLISIISSLKETTSIEGEQRIKLRAEWKQCSANCQDSHKRAVYGMFLGFDCHDVNTTIEDWIWSRIFSYRHHPLELLKSFRQLQTTVCIEFGEKYFVTGDNDGYLFYFSTLLFTGQFERAVDVLLRANYKTYAVHLAILLYQNRLLLVSDDVSSEILTCDFHDQTICVLNFARIILLYIKDFELTNINYALNYCFFLRAFNLGNITGGNGKNLFESCVSRIVYLSGEVEKILGKSTNQGQRFPGLIDKFAPVINVSDVISRIANDTDICGDSLLASNFFILANRPADAIRLTCKQLCLTMPRPNSEETLKAIKSARRLVELYTSELSVSTRPHNFALATLYLVVELYEFFLAFSKNNHQQALTIFRDLKLLPLDPDEVTAYVNSFEMVPIEVKSLLPEICSTLMKIIVSLYDSQPPNSPVLSDLKNFAKAVVLYSAMIPYNFPLSTNSLLLQLQSKIL